MGQRNMQYTSHMIDLETDQHSRSHLHPEPCLFYGNVTNFPQPNVHSVIPAPGNSCSFSIHHMPEHHDNALFYGMTQYNGLQHQHPAPGLDLAVAVPSSHYEPYMVAPSGVRDFPVPVTHGAHDQLSLSGTHRITGVPTDSFGRNVPYMDSIRGSFKRKNAEGMPGNFQYHYTAAGSSSSVVPMTVRPIESDVNMIDDTSFVPPEYGGNETSSMVESGSHISTRNRSTMIGHDSLLPHNNNHLTQGNYVTQAIQLPGNPWLDMHFSTNGGDIGTFGWNQAPNLPYMHGCIEAGNMGVQSYQVAANNRSSSNIPHPPIPQGHLNLHPMQGMRGYHVNLPPQLATSSRRTSAVHSSNTSVNPFQDVVETGPAYWRPAPPTGFRFYRPQRREFMLDSNVRHRNLPHLRVLPEDEVAMLEIPGYHEVGNSLDQHRELRLDIDHMSYEELLALEEQIGNVGTGLSAETIGNSLKLRTFVSSATCSSHEEPKCKDQEVNFCVICQTDYEENDKIGTLECGHEYHGDCIKKWLLMKNTCPICKSVALTAAEQTDL